MDILSCLKSFTATVDCKSFSAAARSLYISPSKLSKQISWLEEELDVILFIRSTTRLMLTEPGQRLYEKTLVLLKQLEQVRAIASPEKMELQGSIQLYLTVTPAVPYLTSLSIEFMQEHPKISMEILVGSEDIGIYSSSFDLALSFEVIKHPKLSCKKLFSIQRNTFASPAYIKQYGSPQTIEELEKHNCLVNTLYGLQDKWVFNKKIIHVSGNFKSNNASVLKQAAVENTGIIWAPYFSVKEEVEQGLLVPVLPQEISPDIMLYAIYPKHLAHERKINQLLQFFYQQALAQEIIKLQDKP